MNIYLSDAEYQALIDAFASDPDAPICPHFGGVDRDRIRLGLGEQLRIWPDAIYDDAVAHGHA